MSGYERHCRLSGAKTTPHSQRRPLENREEDDLFSNYFLKSKMRTLCHDTSLRSTNQSLRHSMEFSHSSSSSVSLEYGTGYRESYRSGLTVGRSYPDKEDSESDDCRWRSYNPSLVGSSEPSYAATTSSSCTECSSFISTLSEQRGSSDNALSPARRQLDVLDPSSTESLIASSRASLEHQMETLQNSYSTLKEENSELKKKLTAVQTFCNMQTEMVRELEHKMQARIAKEDLQGQDLEQMDQGTHVRLAAMSKRAEEAENTVQKLKEDLRALEIQLIYFQRENQLLHTGQGSDVLKHSTGTVLQNIDLVRNSIQGSLKHLVYGADALKLVVEILKSVDQIAENKEKNE